MGQPLPLRPGYGAPGLRALARRSKDAPQSRRPLAPAAIYDGGTRSEAARLGSVTLQIVRDWVLRFNAAGPEGLIDRKAPGQKAPGQRPRLTGAHRAALAATIEAGPPPAVHGVVRRRLVDLGQWLWEAFRVPVSKQTLSRELRAMGYRKLSARPRHRPGRGIGPAAASRAGRRRHRGVQKSFPAALAGIAQERGAGPEAIEVWFADEARVGQKDKITRRWAPRGSRPAAPQDQRTASTHIFGAVCPWEGKGAALVLPFCNSAAMDLHLAEVSAMVAPGRHAVRLLDRAGWHLSGQVEVPPNITLLPLPPKCPELNVMENVWRFMRDNWLSDRVFQAYDDIVDRCCHAWNRLIDQPWRIISLGLREWAHGF